MRVFAAKQAVPAGASNRIEGTIVQAVYSGASVTYHIRVANRLGRPLLVFVQNLEGEVLSPARQLSRSPGLLTIPCPSKHDSHRTSGKPPLVDLGCRPAGGIHALALRYSPDTPRLFGAQRHSDTFPAWPVGRLWCSCAGSAYVDLKLNHAVNGRLNWTYRKPVPDIRLGSWSAEEFGEWGLRFSAVPLRNCLIRYFVDIR